MMGDPTPKYKGLLSLNPLSHFDIVGTTLMFLTALGSGGRFLFGWTKYVDYDPSYFKHKDLSELIIGIAGVGSFFIIIFISKILASIFHQFYLIFFLVSYFSAFLLVINLIPLKGFEGDIILKVILRKIDRSLYYKWEEFQFRNYFLVVILFIVSIYLFSPLIVNVVYLLMSLGGWRS
jgi:Zn-dependent protease